MEKYCLSCAAPLWSKDFKGPAEDYCKHCTDEGGQLKPFDDILLGTAQWLKNWQPDLDEEKAKDRATHYLRAMPAWAD